MIPRTPGVGGWRTAVRLALAIAATVAVVGFLLLTLGLGESPREALAAVLPGAALGAVASLVFAALGGRRSRLQDQLDRMDDEAGVPRGGDRSR